MGRELWEIVRADELKVGDVVSFSEYCASGEITGIAPHYLGIGMVQTVKDVGGVMLDSPDVTVFRRVDPADDPRVLRRAMRLIHFALYDEKVHVPMAGDPQNYIDQARRELESEVRDGPERTDGLQG